VAHSSLGSQKVTKLYDGVQQLKKEEREKAVVEFLSRLEQVRVGGGEVQGGGRCPEGHPLFLRREGGERGWICDLCDESKAKKDEPWRCAEDSCDYDVCSTCMDKYQVRLM